MLMIYPEPPLSGTVIIEPNRGLWAGTFCCFQHKASKTVLSCGGFSLSLMSSAKMLRDSSKTVPWKDVDLKMLSFQLGKMGS